MYDFHFALGIPSIIKEKTTTRVKVIKKIKVK